MKIKIYNNNYKNQRIIIKNNYNKKNEMMIIYNNSYNKLMN